MTTKAFFSLNVLSISGTACLIRLLMHALLIRLDKFWQHQAVKFDFTVDLPGTGNRSEEVIQ